MIIFYVFLSIIAIIFGILQIILFFKLWSMTNNVKQMKNMFDLLMRNQYERKGTNIED